MDPKGKVAVLTGGARIGQVVAHTLALRGCNLALTYRGSRDATDKRRREPALGSANRARDDL